MKKIIAAGLVCLTVFSMAVPAYASVYSHNGYGCNGHNYVDANGDGICDTHHYIDEDNDGVCDYYNGGNSNGVCGHNPSYQGTGRGHGCRNGGRHHS